MLITFLTFNEYYKVNYILMYNKISDNYPTNCYMKNNLHFLI